MRKLVFYKTYFQDFYDGLDERAKIKVDHVLFVLENQPIVPQKFVKHISGSSGIFEARASVGSYEYRILIAIWGLMPPPHRKILQLLTNI